MTLSWRRLKLGRHAAKHLRHGESGGDIELTIPSHFRCPISLDLMKDPVTLSTGITYDRQSIETWLEAGNVTCPITNQVLTTLEPIPNHTIRKMIQDWCVEKHSFGIDRITTPRTRSSSMEIGGLLSRIKSSAEEVDRVGCIGLVQKIESLAKESERNKRSIVANGAASVLAAAFGAFASTAVASSHENDGVLEEILSALTLLFPLDREANLYLGSTESLHCMVRFLDGGDLLQRRSAVLVLKEALSFDKQKTTALEEIEGALEALVKLIKEPICPTSTKAALVIIYHMLNSTSTSNSRESVKERFVQMGLVSMLSELAVDTERSICEKALGVLDAICGSKLGREEARDNALTMPVVVKKLLRVSNLATEFAVSILWKLCKKENEDEGDLALEVLQEGAFQKLLLLLQVGCAERTKEKATELLKVLNLHRARLECIESMDFKELKRPF